MANAKTRSSESKLSFFLKPGSCLEAFGFRKEHKFAATVPHGAAVLALKRYICALGGNTLQPHQIRLRHYGSAKKKKELVDIVEAGTASTSTHRLQLCTLESQGVQKGSVLEFGVLLTPKKGRPYAGHATCLDVSGFRINLAETDGEDEVDVEEADGATEGVGPGRGSCGDGVSLGLYMREGEEKEEAEKDGVWDEPKEQQQQQGVQQASGAHARAEEDMATAALAPEPSSGGTGDAGSGMLRSCLCGAAASESRAEQGRGAVAPVKSFLRLADSTGAAADRQQQLQGQEQDPQQLEEHQHQELLDGQRQSAQRPPRVEQQRQQEQRNPSAGSGRDGGSVRDGPPADEASGGAPSDAGGRAVELKEGRQRQEDGQRRRDRTPWTVDEIEKLLIAMEVYGRNWSKIQRKTGLRNQVDLKDKWNNLVDRMQHNWENMRGVKIPPDLRSKVETLFNKYGHDRPRGSGAGSRSVQGGERALS